MRVSAPKAVVTATLTLCALSLVGVGAHASFTQTATASQSITLGVADLEIVHIDSEIDNHDTGGVTPGTPYSGPGETSATFTIGQATANWTETLTFTVKNVGNLPITSHSVFWTGTDDDTLMEYMKYGDTWHPAVTNPDTGKLDYPLYVDQVESGEVLNDDPDVVIQPGDSFTFYATFDVQGEDAGAQDESITPTLNITGSGS